MSADRFVPLAIVGAPHGVRGEVRVKSFAADPEKLGAYGPLATKDGRRFEIERQRLLKGDMLVAKFRGVEDRTAAEAMKGMSLGVDRGALPAPEAEEFYYADLIGLLAVDATGTTLGRVATVENYGAGDFLEIAGQGGPPLLVAFTKANVPDIDIAGGRIVVSPPIETEAKPEEGQEEA